MICGDCEQLYMDNETIATSIKVNYYGNKKLGSCSYILYMYICTFSIRQNMRSGQSGKEVLLKDQNFFNNYKRDNQETALTSSLSYLSPLCGSKRTSPVASSKQTQAKDHISAGVEYLAPRITSGHLYCLV